jgi:RimJ/RimL family protein N-acetyltransferase
MVVLDRAVRRLLSLRSFRRIEASTEADFKQGCRWLEMLDFQSEGLMRKYGPDGADHIRYARI